MRLAHSAWFIPQQETGGFLDSRTTPTKGRVASKTLSGVKVSLLNVVHAFSCVHICLVRIAGLSKREREREYDDWRVIFTTWMCVGL